MSNQNWTGSDRKRNGSGQEESLNGGWRDSIMRNKKQKRILKNKNKLKKELKRKSKNTSAFLRVLEFADAKEDFLSLPYGVRQSFFKESPWPNYQIRFEGDHKDYKLPKEYKKIILSQVEETLSEVTLDCCGKKINFNDVRYLIAAYGLFNYSSKLNADGQNIKIKKIKEISVSAFQKIKPFLREARDSYVNAFINYSLPIVLMLFDYENGYFPTLKVCYNKKGNAFPVLFVRPMPLKRERLTTKDGSERLAFPCVNFTVDGLEIKPVNFRSNVIENENLLHVYIQDHAINRLKERLDLPIGKRHLMEFLGRSLADPVVVGKDGDSFLIEYRLAGYKLGYLIVSNEGNYALVRSFKFITMTGTPEFKSITKKLRASKHDMTYLKLDQLDSMLFSDLFQDEKMKEILTSCDLGHLNELAETIKSDLREYETVKIADNVKNLLNLDD